MAAKKQNPDQADDELTDQADTKLFFKLKNNHGLIVNGKTSAFYEAGTEFDQERDAVLITQLTQSGAQFE